MAKQSKRKKSLRAGAAVESLMKRRPTGAVHDPILAKAVVFDNGRTRVAIVGTDLGSVRENVVDDAVEWPICKERSNSGGCARGHDLHGFAAVMPLAQSSDIPSPRCSHFAGLDIHWE